MAINVHLTHYRWGNDDGTTEANYTFAAAQDTALPVVAEGATLLLRVGMQETGGTAAGNHDFQLRRSINGGAFANVTTTSTHVKAVAAASFADAASPTQRLSGMTGTFESSSQTCSEDGLAGGAQCDIAASGNAECVFAVQFVAADLNPGDVCTFDITSPDSTITNDVVPTATIASPKTATPTTLALTTTKFAPTVTATANVFVTPTTLALTTTKFAPTVAINTLVTPVTKLLSLSTFAPTVAASDHRFATPGTASLAVSTFAPTVTTPRLVIPGTVALAVTTFVPLVSAGAGQTVTPGVVALTISTFAPTVTAGAGVTVNPDTLALSVSTFVPDVAVAGSAEVTPEPVALVITSFSPTVIATKPASGGMSGWFFFPPAYQAKPVQEPPAPSVNGRCFFFAAGPMFGGSGTVRVSGSGELSSGFDCHGSGSVRYIGTVRFETGGLFCGTMRTDDAPWLRREVAKLLAEQARLKQLAIDEEEERILGLT